MIGTLLYLFILGVVALVVLSVGFAVVGGLLSAGFSLLGFLLFTVGPVLLVGWVVYKLLQRGGRRREISNADRAWLEGHR